MIRKSLIAAAALAALASAPTYGARCRNPKTQQFMPCPKPAEASSVTRDKNGKCHIASGKNKGKYTKCP